jgi:hypothetical protein
MGRSKKKPSAAWGELEAKCLWEEQIAYEMVRPVLLLNQSVPARAAEVGVAPRATCRIMEQVRSILHAGTTRSHQRE